MTASRSARERKAASQAGPLARVKIDLDEHQQFVYKISCSACVVRGHLNWSAYRPGGDNSFIAAMDRWVFHLNEKHPGTYAPCMAVSLSGDDVDKLRGYWKTLSDGGTVSVPLEKQMWGDEFGMCVDQFQIAWMVNIGQPQA